MPWACPCSFTRWLHLEDHPMSQVVERVKASNRQSNQVASGTSLRRAESKTMWLPRIPGWAAASIYVLLTFVFYSSILFGNKFLWEDFVEQEFPFRTLASSSLAQGIIPHWDPYIFAGMPFSADIQTAIWYPTNLIQAFFVKGGYESPVVMEWFILLHYALAGFGMFLFAKKLFDIDDWSALFAGIAYAFSGFIVAQAMHQMIVYQMAIFPLAAYMFLRGINSWKFAICSGLLLGAMYLAGHPQSTLYLTFLLGTLAAYEMVTRSMKKYGETLRGVDVLRMAIPVIIALGLFAIQYLPAQELADLSRRDVMTYQKSVEGSLTWGHLLTLVMPRLFGLTNGAHDAKVAYWNGPFYLSWETAIYIGILPLVFGALAALGNWRKKYVLLFAVMSVFAMLFALGDHFFLYKIFFNFPLFNKLRTPARMMMVFSVSMCALSALGVSEVVKGLQGRMSKVTAFAAPALVALIWLAAIAGIISTKSFLASAPEDAAQSISWAAGLATLPVLGMLVVIALSSMGKLRGMPLAIGCILLTTLELFMYGMGVNAAEEDPRTAFREQQQLTDMLKADQQKELSRARTRLGSSILVKRNQGAYDRIQLIEGYNPLVLQRVSPQMANDEGSLDLMNIKWSIMPGQGGQVGFGQRTTYLPRVKMYYSADVHSDEDAQKILKENAAYDYRNQLLIEENPSIPMGQADPNATAQVTSYGQNAITTKVKTASNGMLFFSEIFYPAWKAYVDGKPAKIFRAFTSLRAVEVPAGDHTVEMRYESDAFSTGSTVTLITLIASIAALLFFIVRKQKPVELRTSEPAVAAN